MKLKVKNINISAGKFLVAVVHKKDALYAHLREGDRVHIQNETSSIVGIIDITDNKDIVSPGEVGVFTELSKQGKFRQGSFVEVTYASKPRSIFHIKKKLLGHELNKQEIQEIVQDIANNRLTDIELTYFVSAGYMHEFSDNEVTYMTQAMVNTGEVLDFKQKIVMDKHCIGGVAGNRTTCVVVPIVAAAGLVIPKTSSRSITSPAGTADTMEVLCNVSLTIPEMKNVIKKCNGCLVWGGSMNLAPADDKIIKVEHPLSLDPVGQLLTSILAKKKSVGATHVLIDIPYGKGAKVQDKKRANLLKTRFESIGKKLGMKVIVIITDGNEPIGNGIGPALEAKDIIWTLQDDNKGSYQLREKAIALAGIMLEMGGKAKKGHGAHDARELIENGKAYSTFTKMIVAQGGKKPVAENIPVGTHTKIIKAKQKARITHIDNANVSAIAKLAGAPYDKGAGVYLHHHVGDVVQSDEKLYTIYAESKEKLQQAVKEAAKHSGILLKSV